MDYDKQLLQCGYQLPEVPEEGASYAGMRAFGSNLLYISGSCADSGDYQPRGKLGGKFTTEEGKRFSRETMLNILAMIKGTYGSLNVVKSFVKLLVFVAGEEGFYDQPAVADGATEFLIEVFGEEAGRPARSAVGIYALPENLPVEIECLIELNRPEQSNGRQ